MTITMRLKFWLLFLSFNVLAYGQNSIEYFPQEQLVLEKCQDVDDASDCMYEHIQTLIHYLLEENRKMVFKHSKDTLNVLANFAVDENLQIIKSKSWFSIKNRKLDKKLGDALEKIFYSLKFTSVSNRKKPPIVSKHILDFTFLVSPEANNAFTPLTSETKYSGGIVEEIPRFPGCEEFNEQDARTCFQQQMQNHIKKYFRYPKAAVEKKISGKVAIVFLINKNGEVENIRTRGPHPILEKEAVRIIKLLPKMVPGKHNGNPVKVPYSIPITFHL